MDWLPHLQWPAMAVTIAGGWLVASKRRRRRLVGFGLFLLSNVLWVAWGWHDGAWALVVLQLFLAVTNGRGLFKNDEGDAPGLTFRHEGAD